MLRTIQQYVSILVLFICSSMILKAAFEYCIPVLFGPQNSAAVYLIDNRTVSDLKGLYAEADTERRLKVFVMPGHEPGFGGAEYKSLKEREMNVALAGYLADYLYAQGSYDVVVGRDNEGWLPELDAYFKDSASDIVAWKNQQKEITDRLIDEGEFDVDGNPVAHAPAKGDVAVRLYGINKWIGENGFDLAVHIHFNDYGSRRRSQPGEFTGFSIYVPDDQYSNSSAARSVAEALRSRIDDVVAPSTAPRERGGIVESQDLIALGSNNTADAPSVLIEYGYIYEPQFQDEKTRELLMREYAYQTFLGIEDFFGTGKKDLAYRTTVLPYRWDATLSRSSFAHPDVLALQFTLLAGGMYPPAGKDLASCPLSGVFGSCTVSALADFQKRSLIDGDGTVVGSKTRDALNALFRE